MNKTRLNMIVCLNTLNVFSKCCVVPLLYLRLLSRNFDFFALSVVDIATFPFFLFDNIGWLWIL